MLRRIAIVLITEAIEQAEVSKKSKIHHYVQNYVFKKVWLKMCSSSEYTKSSSSSSNETMSIKKMGTF
jgi:hypothetical protein